MKSDKQFFSVTHRGHLFAVIEAADADEARERIKQVRNPAYIPQECDVEPFWPHHWLREPVFYDADSRVVEDELARLVEEATVQYP